MQGRVELCQLNRCPAIWESSWDVERRGWQEAWLEEDVLQGWGQGTCGTGDTVSIAHILAGQQHHKRGGREVFDFF